MMASYLPLAIASTSLSVSISEFISGCRSYVATCGDGISSRVSPTNSSSRPPLKKKVTCAYFSVSEIRSCVLPCFSNHSPNTFVKGSGANAIGALMSAAYSVIITKALNCGDFFLSKPLKSASTKARVISRARSALKLAKITVSPSLISAAAWPSGTTVVAATNSSFSSRAYAASSAVTPSV